MRKKLFKFNFFFLLLFSEFTFAFGLELPRQEVSVYIIEFEDSFVVEKNVYKKLIERIDSAAEWYGSKLNRPKFRLRQGSPVVINKKSYPELFANTTLSSEDFTYKDCERFLAQILDHRPFSVGGPVLVFVLNKKFVGHGRVGFSCMDVQESELMEVRKNPVLLGGLIHELGHVFGLRHPANPYQEPLNIMGFGWSRFNYKSVYLSPEDLEVLSSQLIFNQTPAGNVFQDIRGYEGGYLIKYSDHVWVDYSVKKGLIFSFNQKEVDQAYIYLVDKVRGLNLRINRFSGNLELLNKKGDWFFYSKSEKVK